MKKLLNIVIPVVVCFSVGFLSSGFQTQSLAEWYPLLHKSSLTPPNLVFPIAWSTLYLLMGISIGLIANSKVYNKTSFVALFGLQLFLNFTWSILFFFLRNPGLAVFNILLLDVLIIYYAIKAYGAVRASSILFIPYILWVSFASYLNIYIYFHN